MAGATVWDPVTAWAFWPSLADERRSGRPRVGVNKRKCEGDLKKTKPSQSRAGRTSEPWADFHVFDPHLL